MEGNKTMKWARIYRMKALRKHSLICQGFQCSWSVKYTPPGPGMWASLIHCELGIYGCVSAGVPRVYSAWNPGKEFAHMSCLILRGCLSHFETKIAVIIYARNLAKNSSKSGWTNPCGSPILVYVRLYVSLKRLKHATQRDIQLWPLPPGWSLNNSGAGIRRSLTTRNSCCSMRWRPCTGTTYRCGLVQLQCVWLCWRRFRTI